MTLWEAFKKSNEENGIILYGCCAYYSTSHVIIQIPVKYKFYTYNKK